MVLLETEQIDTVKKKWKGDVTDISKTFNVQGTENNSLFVQMSLDSECSGNIELMSIHIAIPQLLLVLGSAV